jgi:hypothetical protein
MPPADHRIELEPIGHVRTAYRAMEDTPVQTGRNPDEPGRLVVDDRYADGSTGSAAAGTSATTPPPTPRPPGREGLRALGLDPPPPTGLPSEGG